MPKLRLVEMIMSVRGNAFNLGELLIHEPRRAMKGISSSDKGCIRGLEHFGTWESL